MWRTDCMHWSTAFYTGDLSICGFWYSKGVLEPNPRGYRGQLNLTGIKWHMDFWLHPNPHIVQGSTVHSIVVGITSSWLCFKSFRFLLIFSFVLLVTEKSVLIYYGCGFVYFNLWFYQLFLCVVDFYY